MIKIGKKWQGQLKYLCKNVKVLQTHNYYVFSCIFIFFYLSMFYGTIHPVFNIFETNKNKQDREVKTCEEQDEVC